MATKQPSPEGKPPAGDPALLSDEELLPWLVAEWRRSRSAEIADAIERLGRQLGDALQDQLTSFAKASTHQLARKRLDTIGEHDEDPRLATAIVAAIFAARWAGSSALPLWKTLCGRLVELRDGRAVPSLRLCAEELPPFLGAAHGQVMAALFATTADALEAAVRPVPVPTWLGAIEDRLTEPPADFFARPLPPGARAAALLAPLWARPDDAALRQVVADALLAEGEPWGEFIALSTRGKKSDSDRIAELLAEHGKLFCGPLAKICSPEGRVFEGGFLVECSVDSLMVPRRDFEAALVAPQWAMIHTVHIGMSSAPAWWIPAFVESTASSRLHTVEIGHYASQPLVQLTRKKQGWTRVGPQKSKFANVEKAAQVFLASR